MNEKHLGYVTIAFVSLIFIAFFATEINKSPSNVTEITGMETASPGGGTGGVCWQDDSTGEMVYKEYIALATASATTDKEIIMKQINSVLPKGISPITNLNQLGDAISSIKDPDVLDELIDDIEEILDQNQLGQLKKFNFHKGNCEITCPIEEDVKRSTYCSDNTASYREVWFGDPTYIKNPLMKDAYTVLHNLEKNGVRQADLNPAYVVMLQEKTRNLGKFLFEKVTKNNIIQRKPGLDYLIANPDEMANTCACKKINKGCCETPKGGFSYGNIGAQGPAQMLITIDNAYACPSPNNWHKAPPNPVNNPNRRPGAPQLGF